MKKKIVIYLLLLLFPCISCYSIFSLYFIYQGKYYEDFEVTDNKEIKIEPFDSIKELDPSQVHRAMLSSQEKAKLDSLFYVGDKYEFNNIRISLIDINEYRIQDMLDNISLTFTLGKYNNVILTSALNFNEKNFDLLDKIASSLAVKILLRKMTGTPELEENEKKNFEKKENNVSQYYVEGDYGRFISELKKLKKQDILKSLKNFIDLNVEISIKNNKIDDEWIKPSDVYYYKKANYKSVAFFYFYSLKLTGLNVRSYLVSPLIRKDEDELLKMYNAFTERDMEKIQEIEFQYKDVDSGENLIEFTDKYINSKLRKPPDLFFYKPPNLQESVFIVTVNMNDRWLYTTGLKWIDANIYSPERVCAQYSRNGCYYAYIDKEYYILNNIPLHFGDVSWNIFYPDK